LRHRKQSIFSAAVLWRNLTEKAEMPSARTATLKMDWAEPFHESCPMGIEWSAELWTKGVLPDQLQHILLNAWT
jgi:hypothetical protein